MPGLGGFLEIAFSLSGCYAVMFGLAQYAIYCRIPNVCIACFFPYKGWFAVTLLFTFTDSIMTYSLSEIRQYRAI